MLCGLRPLSDHLHERHPGLQEGAAGIHHLPDGCGANAAALAPAASAWQGSDAAAVAAAAPTRQGADAAAVAAAVSAWESTAIAAIATADSGADGCAHGGADSRADSGAHGGADGCAHGGADGRAHGGADGGANPSHHVPVHDRAAGSGRREQPRARGPYPAGEPAARPRRLGWESVVLRDGYRG